MSDKIVMGRAVPEVRGLLDALLEECYPGLVAQATPENLARLREQHVALYRRNLDCHYRYVNVEETERLLSVWMGVEGKEFAELSDDAKLEVLDALAAETT